MSAVLAAIRPWPWSRQRAAVFGLALAALGLAHRLAFTVTWAGLVLVSVGLLVMAATAFLRPWPGPRASPEELNLVFTATLVLAILVGAVRPYREDALVSALTIAAAVVFLAMEATSGLRRARLLAVTPLLLLAHALLIMDLPFPKQDVFRFLTYGVDGLFHHGLNPYLPIPDPISRDVLPYTFTYPPGALLVAPFRLLLGDVRWAFVAAEAVYVVAVSRMAPGEGPLPTWRQAAILLPLVLPRTNQAYFDFGNHEWLLLALAAAALALRRHWRLSGVLLGLGVVSKQYFVVFPLLFLVPWLSRRLLGLAGIVAVGAIIPFLAWDSGHLVHDLTNQLGAPADPDRLTLYATLRGAGWEVGQRGAGVLAATGLALAMVCARRGRHSLDRALVACGVGLGAFTLFADFSAYNYFGYALAFAAWGIALSDPGEGEEARGAGGVGVIPRQDRGENPLLHAGTQ